MGILCQMYHVGLRLLVVEHASLTNPEIRRRCCLESGFLPYEQGAAKLPRQVGVEHVERSPYRRGSRQAPDGQHRPAQEVSTRQALMRDLGGLGTTAVQYFVLLWRNRWFINTHRVLLHRFYRSQ